MKVKSMIVRSLPSERAFIASLVQKQLVAVVEIEGVYCLGRYGTNKTTLKKILKAYLLS